MSRTTDEQIREWSVLTETDHYAGNTYPMEMWNALAVERERADKAEAQISEQWTLHDRMAKNIRESEQAKGSARFSEGYQAAIEDGLCERWHERLIDVLWKSRRMWQERALTASWQSDYFKGEALKTHRQLVATEARIEAVRKVHQQCAGACLGCDGDWPCPTIEAVDGS